MVGPFDNNLLNQSKDGSSPWLLWSLEALDGVSMSSLTLG
jgi:hypothetical protein